MYPGWSTQPASSCAPQPRSFAELTTLLTGLVPDGDPGAMRYAVRTHLPLIQVPVAKTWSYPGNPQFTLADGWLGTALPNTEHLGELVKRYLAAFGPATVADMQTWSYLPNLQPVFETLRPDLVWYRDERRRELFDLPELAIAADDVPAPVRFLPEFDNLLLAHQDRTRVMPKAFRSKVYLPGLRVAATVLIDGFVAATWTTERVKQAATVVIEPFEPLVQTRSVQPCWMKANTWHALRARRQDLRRSDRRSACYAQWVCCRNGTLRDTVYWRRMGMMTRFRRS